MLHVEFQLSRPCAGATQILLHPRWGSSIYPASMFVKAPVAEIQAALAAASGEMSAQ